MNIIEPRLVVGAGIALRTKADLIDNFIRFTGPGNLTSVPAMSVRVTVRGDPGHLGIDICEP